MGAAFYGCLWAYYILEPEKEPNLENYPLVDSGFRFLGVQGSKVFGVFEV